MIDGCFVETKSGYKAVKFCNDCPYKAAYSAECNKFRSSITCKLFVYVE